MPDIDRPTPETFKPCQVQIRSTVERLCVGLSVRKQSENRERVLSRKIYLAVCNCGHGKLRRQ